MALVRRRIKLNIRLAQETGTNQPNTFVENQNEEINIEGLRVLVRIQNAGSPTSARASVQVFGLAQSLMNQLATLGLIYNIVSRNTMTISAGDENGKMSTIYTGTIYTAYWDANQPRVSMNFECVGYAADAVISAAPTSYVGSVSIETIMAGFARQMNVGFQNSGVSGDLVNPSYTGGVREQAQQCADDAKISWAFVDGKLVIWPLGGSRTTPSVPEISVRTGMIGYPSFTQQGIMVKSVFNPVLSMGSLVKVVSGILQGIADAQNTRRAQVAPTSMVPATWAIYKLDMVLDSEAPNGEWMSIVYANNPGYAQPVVRG